MVVNEAGDTPFHLECISGDLEMIKCLDDGKGNLDSKYNGWERINFNNPVMISSLLYFIAIPVQRSRHSVIL